MRVTHGLECAWLSDWSARGSRTGVRGTRGLECAGLADWSARGSWTGVREAHGLECARLADWSARDSRTGVHGARGLECMALMPPDVAERAKERAFITAQNAFLDKIHFAQLSLVDECIISYSAEFVKWGFANLLTGKSHTSGLRQVVPTWLDPLVGLHRSDCYGKAPAVVRAERRS